MKIVKHFLQVINLQTLVVTTISLVATSICLYLEFTIELPTALIGIAIVFPIVFSINAAYRRREEALRYFASLKAHAASLFYAHRDWLPERTLEHAQRMVQLMARLLEAIHLCFSTAADSEAHFQQVYNLFSELSLSMERLRDAGVSGSEVSRANQYLRAMMIEFERMRNIYTYRTPTALRAYSQIFLNSFPIVFAPTFAQLSQETTLAAGFLVAALYSLVLVSLDNIQECLENPYDGVGADDLRLDIGPHYTDLLVHTLEE